ncbi:MAG: sigma-54-dependent Fis family transcriptional regulator [Hyphomicrobiaceae bacterium]|nr:sigma-54-dependent Fis family transcriptional regulator [Hyphomicrobiaceae bacterium]
MTNIDKHILVVDDDPSMRDSLKQLLETTGWNVTLSESAETAIKSGQLSNVTTVLTDVKMPGMSGLDFMAELKKKQSPPVVLISAHGDITKAVEAIHNGAYSFVAKPFDPHQLLQTLNNAAEQHRLQCEAHQLKRCLSETIGLERALPGSSASIVTLREEIVNLHPFNAPLLLIGETGTNKKLVARACHNMRAKSDSTFITLQCSRLSDENLIQYEIDLRTLKQIGGTLLLDHIDACPITMQPALTRLIEPIIDASSVERTVTIISTAEKDLVSLLDESHLLAELYFMISTVVLTIPPLRDRPRDISELHGQFLALLSKVYQLDPPIPTTADLTELLSYNWPGNVRELRNIAERQMLGVRRGDPSVATALAINREPSDVPPTLRTAIAALERELIAQAIKANQGRMDPTARALGIARRTLNEKIVKLGLDKNTLF